MQYNRLDRQEHNTADKSRGMKERGKGWAHPPLFYCVLMEDEIGATSARRVKAFLCRFLSRLMLCACVPLNGDLTVALSAVRQNVLS